MKRKIQPVLAYAILGLGIYYFSQKGAELSQLRQMTALQFAITSLAILLSHLLAGLKLKLLLLSQKVRLTPSEWLGLPNIRKLGNILVFKSGTISNAYYLKLRHNLSYSKFILIFTAEKITSLYANTIMSLITCLFFFVYHELNFYIVLFFILLLISLTYLLVFSNFKIPKYEFQFLKIISNVFEHWNKFKNKKAAIYQLITLEVFSVYVIGLRLYIAFNILNQPINFSECVIMSICIALSGFFNLVPGGLGIREGVVGLTTKYLGYRFDFGVIATTFDRIISTFWFSVFGFIFFRILSFKKHEKSSRILTET